MGSNILLALGSLVMFGTFLGSSNRLLIGNTQIASQNEYYIAALSYAQSVIEEARTKKFDGTLSATAVNNIGKTVLTPAGGLGADASSEKLTDVDVYGEGGFLSQVKFDDIDDYHNYRRLVNSSRAEGYQMVVNVSYIDPLKPNVPVASQTNAKLMVVKITSPFFPRVDRNGMSLPDTLVVSSVFSRY